jgi:hypothetical protein
MSEILIRVKAECDTYYDGSCGVYQEVVSVEQIIKEQKSNLRYRGYVQINPDNGKIDKETADLLRGHGWIHLETANSREERKVVEQEYYLLDEGVKSIYNSKFSHIDIENITDEQLKQLAGTGKLVQVVGPKSVLSVTQYKKLQVKRQQIEAQKLKSKLSAEKKAQKKKAKEIADAKKLLKEANQL